MNAIASPARAAGVAGIVLCVFFTPLLVAQESASPPQPKPRARDLPIPFDGAPGPIQATEEAVDNALVAAETRTAADNWRSCAIPHDQLRKILRDHNRFVDRGAN